MKESIKIYKHFQVGYKLKLSWAPFNFVGTTFPKTPAALKSEKMVLSDKGLC